MTPSRTQHERFRQSLRRRRGAASGEGRRARPTAALLRSFLGLLAPHRRLLAVSFALLAVSTLAGLVLPAMPKFAIDYVLSDDPGPAGLPDWLGLHDASAVTLLVLLAGASLASSAIAQGGEVLGRWRFLLASKRLTAGVRRRLFGHAIRLPLERVEALKSGGATSLLRNDTAAPTELLFATYHAWRAAVQLLATLVVLALVDWWLVVFACVLPPAIFVTHRAWIGRIRPVSRATHDVRQDIDGRVAETFGAIRAVRIFGQERCEIRRFATSTHLMVRHEILAWWWGTAVEVAWRLLIPTASAAVLLYCGTRVLDGALTVGDIVLFLMYTAMLLGPLESLVTSAASVQLHLGGFERVLDVLEEPAEFPGGDALPRPTSVRGCVELDDVWFRYPGHDRWVLEGVSLRAEPGQTVAVVGATGAGKSTLLNLIARFYDPTRGAVRLDGTDVRRFAPSAYRALFGVVEQDVVLFDGTIRDNIGYANSDASGAEIERAARLAHIHDFIAGLADGYDTQVGERGVGLSGGQKQRLAIARAILADPRILILDEATSALDAESEALIQDSLDALMMDKTTFVIAHRLSTIRGADKLIVLRDGCVAEVGEHDELLARGGLYARFWAAQQGAATAAPADRPDVERGLRVAPAEEGIA